MDAEAKRKCLREEEEKLLDPNHNSGEDLISDLPDCVLAHILSKLPTKFAVGTAVLSTRWKRLFPLIPEPQIQFDDSLFLNPQDQIRKSSIDENAIPSFADFTSRILDVLLKEVPVIYSFKLKCSAGYSDNQILDWVNSALDRDPRIVEIGIHMDSPWLLYDYISERDSIWCLALFNDMCVCVPDSFLLPNLYCLILDRIYIGDSGVVSQMLSGCPVLKRLTMRNLELLGVDDFSITIPSLEHLDIQNCWFGMAYDSYHTVVVDTPALEELYYEDITSDKLIVKNLNSLRTADIYALPQEDLDEDNALRDCKDIAALVRACSNVRKLYLSKDTISAIKKSGEDLPTFGNLSELVLGGFDINGWKLLAELLEKTPKLETLCITKGFHVEEEGCFDIFFSDIVERKKKSRCMLSSLAKLEIFKLKGGMDELDLIHFFFLVGKVLNRVRIVFDMVSCESYDNLRNMIGYQALTAGILDRCVVTTGNW